jgi:phosphotriesterase-related protein
MLRREFLLSALAAARVDGSILVHEHVLVDFIGAEKIRPGRYDADEVFRVALPKLKELTAFGCVRMLECTPNFLGRNPRLLRRLSDACGIELWTNTGLYGAKEHAFLPAYARTESAEQLAQRWMRELREGVDGIRPRFVKIGVNEAPLHSLDRKLVEAAALTSEETGVTVASHTSGRGPAALEQLEIFDRLGVPANRFVWVHAQNERDLSLHEKAARAGAWVEFDNVSEKSADWHRQCVLNLHEKGLAGRVLISQDSGWYHVGEPSGGQFNSYSWIYTGFLQTLDQKLSRELMVANPRDAFGS